MSENDYPAGDPDCPSCGTRCHPARGGGWVCRWCGVAVIDGGGPTQSRA